MLKARLIYLALFIFSCNTENKIVVVFGGDVMLDRGIRSQITLKGIDHLTEGIKPVFENSDFAIVNLECPVTSVNTPLTKKFVFRAEPEWLAGLYQSHITHCIMANNHSYDHGRDELIATAQNLRNSNLTPVGYGITQHDACSPVLLNKNGIEIAIFPSVTLNLEAWMYLENLPGMCQATVEDLKQAVASYRKNHSQAIIILTLHWGVEYQRTPTAMQRMQARELVEAGADAIIGHHPHVVQSFERIEGKPVFYSIGNLIFDNPNPMTHEGILVRLTVKDDLSNTEIIPYKSIEGKPILMSDEERNEWMRKFQDYSD